MTARQRTRRADFWRQRTRREQAFLTVMLACLAAFVYWFGLLAPLRAMAADAEQRHIAARAQQLRFPGLLQELAARQGMPPTPLDADALLQNATAAGLSVSAGAAQSPGQLKLRFEAMPAQAVFGWLSQLRQSHHLAPLEASLRRTPSGLEGELVFDLVPP